MSAENSIIEYLELIRKQAKPMSDDDRMSLWKLKLVGELGELVDPLAKTVFHGFALDAQAKQKAVLECGDFVWYVLNIAQEYIQPQDIQSQYHALLAERAPEYVDLSLEQVLHHIVHHTMIFFRFVNPGSLFQLLRDVHILGSCFLDAPIYEIIAQNVIKLSKRLPKGEYDERDFQTNREAETSEN